MRMTSGRMHGIGGTEKVISIGHLWKKKKKRAVILERIWEIHRHPLSTSIGVALDWIGLDWVQGKLKGVFGQRERGTAPGVVDRFTVSSGRHWKLYIPVWYLAS